MRWRQQVTKDALRRDMMGRAAAIERELEEAKEKGDKLAEAIALNNLGAVFADLHEWTEALENYEKAAEEVPDEASIEDRATPHGNAALAARQLREWPKALYHTLYVDAIGTQAGDTDQQTIANAGVGIVRHSFPPEEFAAMIDAAIAELPEALREFVRRDQHLNPTVVGDDKPGRNDPCYCGSGKKYKHCHLKTDREAADA